MKSQLGSMRQSRDGRKAPRPHRCGVSVMECITFEREFDFAAIQEHAEAGVGRGM